MRLIVLDTNVLVSAGIDPDGPPAKIVADLVLAGTVQVVTSPVIVAGYREVFRHTKFFRYGFPPLWLKYLIEESLRIPDSGSWPCACPDLTDVPFIALAHAAGAWLVTGNLKHFSESYPKWSDGDFARRVPGTDCGRINRIFGAE
jgi:predicted nucleic acid-binding protein